MHYLIHVFTEPNGSVEDALEPFRERDGDDDNVVGEWDYWSEGGRWHGYFDGVNAVSAADALTVKTPFAAPYAYVTLDGRWVAKEEYVPEGFSDPTDEFPEFKSYFRPVEDYEDGYRAYVESVPQATVTTVDIHS